MANSRLPLDVKTFLTESIDSVSHLEVLLMFYNNKDREYSPAEVAKEMRSNEHSAHNQLKQLTSKGLFATVDEHKFRYWPVTPELDDRVRKLAQFYNEMPVAVVTAIYEKPKEILKDFSDAFKFKKD